MLDGRWRHAVDRTTKPVGAALVRAHVTADVLTVVGLVMAAVTALVVASGHFVLGVVMLFPTGLPDLFDGPVAKAAGTASVRGAFFDSVSDRVADALMFGGVAWYLAARHHGTAVLIPFAILAMTQLISYERAKAELLGLSAKGGLMERAERFILLGLCFIAGAVSLSAFVPALWVFFGLISATAIGRFVRVWQEAEGPVRPPVPERPDSRWRTWREAWAHREAAAAAGRVTRYRPASDPLTRWRTRRDAATPARSARSWRARRPARTRLRTGRHAGPSGY
ncbi:MAG TPA: CDP-alcohol phosphatidyltransferase family protein [Acidimicrobiales bacterium]|nr:CDP-alcohol phosphatidyltransferase family protein [Acidimicrobiales bacterium]